jgi:diaminopropionate ammonia-lyase
VPGNYDAAVAAAREASQAPGCVLIQDTSFEGYTLHCQRIMYGYMLMAQEIRMQLAADEVPTHVFLQVGCGGLAAAVAADFWLAWGARRPRVVAVQSTRAASLLRSLEAGRRTVVDGDLDTAMVGIACGEISMLAWDILRDEVALAIAIEDGPAFEAMRLLATGEGGDVPVVIGETGAAGIGALLELTSGRVDAGAAALDAQSRVLLIGSEGALDAASYQRVVGVAPG